MEANSMSYQSMIPELPRSLSYTPMSVAPTHSMLLPANGSQATEHIGSGLSVSIGSFGSYEVSTEHSSGGNNTCRGPFITEQQHYALDILDDMFPGDLIAQGGSAVFSRRRRAGYMPTPDYLPAIADPVLLSAWLFVKLKPWGPNHCWADDRWLTSPPRTFDRPLVEVLELRGVVYRTLLNACTSGNITRDPYYPDALIMMSLFVCQTDGFKSALVHCEFLNWLAYQQIKIGGLARDTYRTTIAIDAFRTVLGRYVKVEYIDSLQRMFTMALQAMRNGVIDLIDGPFEHIKEPVWRRTLHLNAAGWCIRYRDNLLAITNVAESIPYDIERVT
ncbi:unnamed protein product [Zymoseptoria tritici ST99CH_1A5]|uniref:Uncharacterized protein n=2 Tax=Zymoseptoria tritici TaxID=1047171 RepID=A0A2H1GT32_ZYMTR|nr:unnamed protein product [Zymoseptoria tritici ST99CH_1E4]SMY26782.1 unnamed protein product [Zymoseptoria tritici ST99CH_1A5]